MFAIKHINNAGKDHQWYAVKEGDARPNDSSGRATMFLSAWLPGQKFMAFKI